jgi:negative regulator of flagellin synthesis FlgM
MKIVNSTIPKPATATANSSASSRAGAKGSAASSASAAAAGSSGDVDAATRLSQLEAQFSQSDFDAGKVSEVTSAIAAGQYKVDAGAVADKLLESASTLTGKSNG